MTIQLYGRIETQLPENGWLVGGNYSVADLTVASVVNLAVAMCGSKLGAGTTAWFEPIKARPAWKKVAAQG